MSARRWLLLISCLLVVGLAVAVYSLPELVRRVAIARIHALTERPVHIDRVAVNLLTGRFTVHGFRLAERDGQAAFADFQQLDVRLHLPSLLVGHLWIREMILSDSTVRVVRLPTNEFNFSDLVRRSGTARRGGDVTVDRFVLRGGTVTLEDRALPESRTWTSEQIAIDARNVSTRRDDGTAVGTSVTAGAPVSVDVKDLRLYPIHVRATVKVDGLDLTLARVYLRPDIPVTIQRGRATTSVTVTLDAREGLRADGTGQLEDIALTRSAGGEQIAVVPTLTTEVDGFAFHDGRLRLGRVAVDGAMRVRDPSAKHTGRFHHASVRANIVDLTWPAAMPGRLELLSSVPGGGRLVVTGTLAPPPSATQLRLRLTSVDLAPWAQFLPLQGRIAGLAEADLRMNEPLAAGVPARLHGSVAVKRLRVTDAREELVRAERVEANGLELHWPTRLVVQRVLVSAPHGVVERDRAGAFRLKDLVTRETATSHATPASALTATGRSDAPGLGVDVGEVLVRNGAVAWRDQSVAPAARLDVSNIDARVTGIGWPLRGTAGVRAAMRPPGGGHLQLTGRVQLDPVAGDVRVTAKSAELAPYQSYLPTAARISGAADLDVAIVVPSLAERRATARGSATLSRLDVRDRERTVVRAARVSATGLDVVWPARVGVGRLTLTQPWLLLERDEKRALPLRELLTTPTADGAVAASVATTQDDDAPVAITVAQLRVDRGGMRIVDRAVSPAFAVDLQPATLRIDGLSTVAEDKPARLDVAGQLGPGADLALRGTLGSLGGPLRLDVNGTLRQFAVPRTNPYLLGQVGWKTTDGRLESTVQCRIDGDALSAKTDIRLSRLHLVRATPHDGAQARIGLPLRVITALMKDKRGDITLSLPVGGRLSDPRFDFSDAIWGAVRAVAINAITLPVSWIGRVRFTPDSRIERIEVDPLEFEPGTSELTPDGNARVARLAAFLDHLPEVNMAVTPVISSRDVEDLGRRRVGAAVDRLSRESRVSEEAAAAQLFEQRFPGRPLPATPEAMIAALAEREAAQTSDIRELAARRLATVRAGLERAGINRDRLAERELVRREDAASEVALDVLEPDAPRRSKVREVLERLGVPLKGSEAK